MQYCFRLNYSIKLKFGSDIIKLGYQGLKWFLKQYPAWYCRVSCSATFLYVKPIGLALNAKYWIHILPHYRHSSERAKHLLRHIIYGVFDVHAATASRLE